MHTRRALPSIRFVTIHNTYPDVLDYLTVHCTTVPVLGTNDMDHLSYYQCIELPKHRD
jgi:hypothetical protein